MCQLMTPSCGCLLLLWQFTATSSLPGGFYCRPCSHMYFTRTFSICNAACTAPQGHCNALAVSYAMQAIFGKSVMRFSTHSFAGKDTTCEQYGCKETLRCLIRQRQAHLDASVAQKLLHAIPGGVSLPHQLEHPLQHLSDGVWGRLQGAYLIQVVRLDLSYCKASSLNDGSHHRQLRLHISLPAVD